MATTTTTTFGYLLLASFCLGRQWGSRHGTTTLYTNELFMNLWTRTPDVFMFSCVKAIRMRSYSSFNMESKRAGGKPKSGNPHRNFKGKNPNMHYKHGQKDEEKERLKKKVLHKFNKLKQKQKPAGLDVQKLYQEMSDSDDEQPTTGSSTQQSTSATREKFQKKKEASRFSRAQWEHQKTSEKKKQKYEEMQRQKQEKEAALQEYRKKKKEKYLKMCKKTPRGQPIMKYRMQDLLEQIEKQHGKKKT